MTGQAIFFQAFQVRIEVSENSNQNLTLMKTSKSCSLQQQQYSVFVSKQGVNQTSEMKN